MTVTTFPAEGGTYNLTESGWYDPYVGTAIEGIYLNNDCNLSVTPNAGWCIDYTIFTTDTQSGTHTVQGESCLTFSTQLVETRNIQSGEYRYYTVEIFFRKRQVSIRIDINNDGWGEVNSNNEVDLSINNQQIIFDIRQQTNLKHFVGEINDTVSISISKISRADRYGYRHRFIKAELGGADRVYTENTFSFVITNDLLSSYEVIDPLIYLTFYYITVTGLILRNSQGIILRGKNDIILRDE